MASVSAAPQTAPNTDPMNCSKLALRVPPRLLWVATTAAITAQKLCERPRVAPSAKVTAGRCGHAQGVPEPGAVAAQPGGPEASSFYERKMHRKYAWPGW